MCIIGLRVEGRDARMKKRMCLLVALAVAFAIAAMVWMVPRRARSYPRAANAPFRPKVTMTRAIRVGPSKVRLDYRVILPAGIEPMTLRVGDTKIGDTGVNTLSGGEAFCEKDKRLDAYVVVTAPQDTRSVTVQQEFYVERPSKRLAIRFDNVSIASLPIVRSVAGAKVAVKRVIARGSMDTSTWQGNGSIRNGQQFTGIEVVRHLSKGWTWGEVWIGFDTVPSPVTPDYYTGPTRVSTSTTPNATEKAVGLLNPRYASELTDRRAQQEVDERLACPPDPPELLAIKVATRPPKRFTLRIPVVPPPDAEDRAWIKFTKVHIAAAGVRE